MKTLRIGLTLIALGMAFPLQSTAGVDVGINISLPAPVVFVSPPELVVIPGTYVYAVANADEDIFFYGGWWWRPWNDGWYRSRKHDSGWAHYRQAPPFHSSVPPGWRNDFRERRWQGRQWNYERIPHRQVQKNWNRWEKSRHWEREKGWGVEGMKRGKQSGPPDRAVRRESPSRPQHVETDHRSESRHGKPERGGKERGGKDRGGKH